MSQPDRNQVSVALSKSDVELLVTALDEYIAAIKRAGGRPSAVAMAASEADLLKQAIRHAVDAGKR